MNEKSPKEKRILPVPRGEKARALLLAAFLVAIAVAIVVARPARVHRIERGDAEMHKLEQIEWAFERSGYPPMASGDTAFRVDLEAMAGRVEVDDQELLDYLAGKTGVEVCYLGHVVASDSAAHLLLDEYVDKGIDQVRWSDIELDHAIFHGWTWRPTRTLRRLLKVPNAEWALYKHDIGDSPHLDFQMRALVPVLWELPNEADPPTRQGGWVLDRNGEVKWKPYPGEFPMTEEFVRRVREMRSMPPGEWEKARARTVEKFPEAERIRQTIRPLQETRFLYGSSVFLSWAIAHLDRRPSVKLKAGNGYRVVLRNESFERWNLTRLDPQAVIELVAFPSDSDSDLLVGLEHRISWHWQRKDDQACAVDLGQGAGYRWFGRAAPPWLGFVQERLALAGGSGYLDELAAWWTQSEDWEMSELARGALARHGAAAISFLEEEIARPRIFAGEDGSDMGALSGTLALMPDTRAGELLVTLYNSEDEGVSAAAQWALVDRPRPEGKAVYLDLLRRKEYTELERRYIDTFAALARAAAQFGGPEAQPLLRELCAHSNEPVASLARVALLERPIPEGLIGILGESGEAEPVPEPPAHDGLPAFTLNARGDLGDRSCLDLDTGRVYEVPVSVAVAEDPGITRGWLRDNGIDLVLECVDVRGTWGLSLLDFRVLSIEDDGWDRSASDVMASVQRAQRAPSDVHEVVEGTVPIVRLFETSEGASGVFRASPFYKAPVEPKTPPHAWLRLSFKLVDGGSAEHPRVMPAPATNAYPRPPKWPTPQNQIGATRGAILAYAQAHEKQWPDSLEDVLVGGYLAVPDPDAFLAPFEYVKPRIPLEELEGVLASEGWSPAYEHYQTVIVVRRKEGASPRKMSHRQ